MRDGFKVWRQDEGGNSYPYNGDCSGGSESNVDRIILLSRLVWINLLGRIDLLGRIRVESVDHEGFRCLRINC